MRLRCEESIYANIIFLSAILLLWSFADSTSAPVAIQISNLGIVFGALYLNSIYCDYYRVTPRLIKHYLNNRLSLITL